jgi:hypothetical protein
LHQWMTTTCQNREEEEEDIVRSHKF